MLKVTKGSVDLFYHDFKSTDWRIGILVRNRLSEFHSKDDHVIDESNNLSCSYTSVASLASL